MAPRGRLARSSESSAQSSSESDAIAVISTGSPAYKGRGKALAAKGKGRNLKNVAGKGKGRAPSHSSHSSNSSRSLHPMDSSSSSELALDSGSEGMLDLAVTRKDSDGDSLGTRGGDESGLRGTARRAGGEALGGAPSKQPIARVLRTAAASATTNASQVVGTPAGAATAKAAAAAASNAVAGRSNEGGEGGAKAAKEPAVTVTQKPPQILPQQLQQQERQQYVGEAETRTLRPVSGSTSMKRPAPPISDGEHPAPRKSANTGGKRDEGDGNNDEDLDELQVRRRAPPLAARESFPETEEIVRLKAEVAKSEMVSSFFAAIPYLLASAEAIKDTNAVRWLLDAARKSHSKMGKQLGD